MRVISLIFLVLAVSLCACIPSGRQARDQAQIPLSIDEQLQVGEQVYTQNCATSNCHGSQGEGVRTGDSFRIWPLIGAEFQLRNPNAQVIFDVVRSGSESNLRALTDQQVYDAIAYELSLNGIELVEVLTGDNAASLVSGAASPGTAWGTLFPPPGNVVLLPPPETPVASTQGDNGSLALRVDQFALASAIDGKTPDQGGSYVISVFVLQALSGESLEVDPQYLRLYDESDQVYQSLSANLAYPIERFHRQTIKPGYGMAAVSVFALPNGSIPARLVYDDKGGSPLEIHLR